MVKDMLKSLRISGFKSALDTNLTFGRVNLFIGANGSGKSNILEAIGMLSAALERGISDNELQRKGVRLSVPKRFLSTFEHQDAQDHFTLTANMDQAVQYKTQITAKDHPQTLLFNREHIRHDNQICRTRIDRTISIPDINNIQQDIAPERGVWDYTQIVPGPPAVTHELNQLGKFCIYTPQTPFLRGTEVESMPVKPLGLLGGELPQAAQTILTLARDVSKDIRTLTDEIAELIWMPGWSLDFSVSEHDPDSTSFQVKKKQHSIYFWDRFMPDSDHFLSSYDSSEGSLYLLFLVTLILHPEAPKIFALDNVDNMLNPTATRTVLEKLITVTCDQRFQEHQIGPEQVFLTSHHPTSLDAFDLFDEEQRIFVVSREEKTGFTKVEPLKPSAGVTRADWIRIAQGKNLSEMWISGMIPNALGNQKVPTL